MILCRTPFRVSFFGGGTDFPEWYQKNPASILSCTINKYCYVVLRTLPPFFDFRYRLRYYKYETTKNIANIKHVAIKKILGKFHDDKQGLEIIHFADLPALSGLGASSAFTVSLINLINFYNNNLISKYDLAKESINMEQKLMKLDIGSQDQIASTYGGFNQIILEKNNFKVKKIIISKNFENNFCNNSSLFFTGIQRQSSIIEKDKIKNLKKKRDLYIELSNLSKAGVQLFSNPEKNFSKNFKFLLNETWKIKKQLSNSVSSNKLDNIYNFALKNGASCGKLLGAGGGGFFYFYSNNQKDKKKLILKMNKFKYIDFNIDYNGSVIINKSLDPYIEK